jgi:peptide/nickel transport system substrate-binding protein
MPVDIVARKPFRFAGPRVAAMLALGLVALPLTTALAQPKDEVITAGAILRQQFDPSIMVATTDHTAFTMLYDGLLNLSDKGKVPALATGWKISDDGKQVDFDLRKNVKFHNGDPFTAEDVKFSYDLLLKDGNSHSYRKAFVDQIKSIEVLDPHKVRFNLNQPWPSFFSSSRYGIQPIIPKNYYEKVGVKGFQ